MITCAATHAPDRYTLRQLMHAYIIRYYLPCSGIDKPN